MDQKTREFMDDLADFCNESMNWCIIESEKATSNINEIVNILIDDASRVSLVSKETIDAITSMKDIINNLSEAGSREIANELAMALSETANEDQEIKMFVSPIMEALQFQDRITQNMNNFSKMMRTWLEMRDELEGEKKLSKEHLVDFGERLMKCTTMIEERNLLRSHFPDLKEDEVAGPKEMLFF